LVLYQEEQDQQGKDEKHRVPLTFTGDSLASLAGLITSKLIAITQRINGIGWNGGGRPYFHVGLTDEGRALVKAWIGKAEQSPSKPQEEGDLRASAST